jgi:hypothetical protein
MSSARETLLYEHGLDIGLDVLSSLTDLSRSVPFLGPFIELLQKAVDICDQFKTNEVAADTLKNRYLDAGCFLEIACRNNFPVKSSVLEDFANKLINILRDANKYLHQFANKGFLTALLVGKKPNKRINDIDEAITKVLKEMSSEVNLTQTEVVPNHYDIACDVEAWLHDHGGYNGISQDEAKLQEFAKLLG